MPKHEIDKVCSCPHCKAIDIMFGDPLLSDWEKKFLASVAFWGWNDNYSLQQKIKITEIFNHQYLRYATFKNSQANSGTLPS